MAAKKKRFIAPEDLYQIELISSARISPNGQHVVYSQQRVERKTEKKFANLWLAATEAPGTTAARQFTYGDQKDLLPRWSPDETQIAFLSTRGSAEKPPQIYLIPLQGGEARPLTDIAGEIQDFSWSPDGKRLLCVVRKTDPEQIEREKDEQKKKLGVVARHYQRVFYKLDGYGYLPHERSHLWLVDAHTGKARQLTDHPIYDEMYPSWSPDGKWIVLVSNRSSDPDFNLDAVDLFLLPASGGELQKISAPIGEKFMPVFSPDGKWIAYYGVEGENVGYKNNSLWIVPTDGSQAPHNLTEKYDVHISAWTINDQAAPEQMPPTWSSDGQIIYFPVTKHGRSVVQSIRTDGTDLQAVIDEEGAAGSFTLDQAQQKMAYIYGTMADPGQVFVLDLTRNTKRGLSRANRALLDNLELGTVETHWIKGPAGNDLQGWILKPPGFDPKRKYPSILEIHGGPMLQYGYLFMHEFYFLASQEYVVYFCNPRGGRGYGEDHTKAIWGGWGGADYDDLMAWTDYVAGMPYIDTSRMGVTGGSYGGYMTVWIIGHTTRYKAAVAQRCVSNMVSMWGSSDFNWAFQIELNNKPPFEDLQKFWDHSPIKYIGKAKTPTLVIHNEMDLRCPIEQGEQVFVALKKLGVESEMVRFPDEFHGLSRNGRTDRRIARLNHIAGWFNRHL